MNSTHFSNIENTELGVFTGEVKAAKAPAVLWCPALGSCVAVILYDQERKIGGLAHVMLPSTYDHVDGHDLKYASHAIKELMRQMDELGAHLEAIKARLVGGALMIRGGPDVGKDNIEAIKKILDTLGIQIIGERLGGEKGRTVFFDLSTGEVHVKENQNQFTI
ncbi:MAG: chemotaxis protein CheD [Candidatus Vogelbacteria bacterium]|nr:chemotaxis protein CheD [Candidatus Vogelbacteria bacterium]